MSPYENHTGLVQSQGAVGIAAGAAKPRVRARRGQATDPHSIAERLRRERITDRMKALQELVPNSNKTDKASMLDEIIEYVKFLQLQVKVLSMSRLGGEAAVAPLVADLPPEGKTCLAATILGQNVGFPPDVMTTAEQEVASLMEDNMGTAMQYLQSKGLCLMPISLATVISSVNTRAASGSSQQVEPSLSSMGQFHMGPFSALLVQSNNNGSAGFLNPSAASGL